MLTVLSSIYMRQVATFTGYHKKPVSRLINHIAYSCLFQLLLHLTVNWSASLRFANRVEWIIRTNRFKQMIRSRVDICEPYVTLEDSACGFLLKAEYIRPSAANAFYTRQRYSRASRTEQWTRYESDEQLEIPVWSACGEFVCFSRLSASSASLW